MINDTLADSAVSGEEAERCLELWANVLALGIRDFSKAEIKRSQLQTEIVDRTLHGIRLVESIDRLSAAFVALDGLLAAKADHASGKARLGRGILEVNKQIQQHTRLVEAPGMRDAILYMGRDEVTEWFWGDETDMGSFRYLCAFFPRLPPIDELRCRIYEDPARYASFSMDKVTRTFTDADDETEEYR